MRHDNLLDIYTLALLLSLYSTAFKKKRLLEGYFIYD